MLSIIDIKHKNLELFLTLEILWIATIHCPIQNVLDGTVFSFGLLHNAREKSNKGYELNFLMGHKLQPENILLAFHSIFCLQIKLLSLLAEFSYML